MLWCFIWIIIMRWVTAIIVWVTIILVLVLLAAGKNISTIFSSNIPIFKHISNVSYLLKPKKLCLVFLATAVCFWKYNDVKDLPQNTGTYTFTTNLDYYTNLKETWLALGK